jgi:hypothetical protein
VEPGRSQGDLPYSLPEEQFRGLLCSQVVFVFLNRRFSFSVVVGVCVCGPESMYDSLLLLIQRYTVLLRVREREKNMILRASHATHYS